MRNWIALIVGLVLAGPLKANPELPREVIINGVELILIPGGTFFLPTIRLSDSTKGYKIDNIVMRDIKAHVDSFYLAKYEARASDFAQLLNEKKLPSGIEYEPRPNMGGDGATAGCSVRRNEGGEYFLTRPQDNLPATHLSWNLARDYAAHKGMRLPTNAEWVRAFRGDDKRIFPWGNDHPDDTYASFQEGATQCHAQAIDGFPKGASPYGIHNMAGNVFEYVEDWMNHQYMANLTDGVRNPLAPEPWVASWMEEPEKMLRGGRWASGVRELSIHGNHDMFPPNLTFNCYGVRFAADVSTVMKHVKDGTATVVRQGG